MNAPSKSTLLHIKLNIIKKINLFCNLFLKYFSNSEKVVDDDIALKLISSVKKDLDNMLQRAAPKRDDRVNMKKAAETRQVTKNWLFYFEPHTKNFHYLDITDSSPVF